MNSPSPVPTVGATPNKTPLRQPCATCTGRAHTGTPCPARGRHTDSIQAGAPSPFTKRHVGLWGGMSRLSAGVPPAPGVHWLASRARSGVCRGVHGTQMPFGWPWCPLLQQCLTPRCVSAHVRQGGFPCRLQTQDLVSCLRVSFFLAPFRVASGVKMGAAGLPLPPSSTVPPTGAKTSPLWSAGAFFGLA